LNEPPEMTGSRRTRAGIGRRVPPARWLCLLAGACAIAGSAYAAAVTFEAGTGGAGWIPASPRDIAQEARQILIQGAAGYAGGRAYAPADLAAMATGTEPRSRALARPDAVRADTNPLVDRLLVFPTGTGTARVTPLEAMIYDAAGITGVPATDFDFLPPPPGALAPLQPLEMTAVVID
jgi:hypothetical protein